MGNIDTQKIEQSILATGDFTVPTSSGNTHRTEVAKRLQLNPQFADDVMQYLSSMVRKTKLRRVGLNSDAEDDASTARLYGIPIRGNEVPTFADKLRYSTEHLSLKDKLLWLVEAYGTVVLEYDEHYFESGCGEELKKQYRSFAQFEAGDITCAISQLNHQYLIAFKREVLEVSDELGDYGTPVSRRIRVTLAPDSSRVE